MTDPTAPAGKTGEDQPAQQETGETTTTLEEAVEKGFLGTHPDPEPNESYTLEGVTQSEGEGEGEGGEQARESEQPSEQPAPEHAQQHKAKDKDKDKDKDK